jgi:hypothetical protein
MNYNASNSLAFILLPTVFCQPSLLSSLNPQLRRGSRTIKLDVEFHSLILELTGSRLIAGMQQVLVEFFRMTPRIDRPSGSAERICWEQLTNQHIRGNQLMLKLVVLLCASWLGDWTELRSSRSNDTASSTVTPSVNVTSVRRVFHNGQHNAFTDMCRYNHALHSIGSINRML